MTEKSQSEQTAAQRQIELLAEALEKARTDGGRLLNMNGKTAPRLYPGDTGVSAFNALVLALHSDRNGYKTDLYTTFSGAKKRNEAVQTGEKGVPFVWYNWNEFQSKSDKDHKISREDYNKLSEEDKKGYSPVRGREIRMLFNIEQTTLPLSDKEAFSKAVKEHGTAESRGMKGADDKRTRMEVNSFLQKMAEGLIPVRRDGIGIAHYDSTRDIVHLPSQKHYADYPEYVQEAIRQLVTATGHPQRLGRPGAQIEGEKQPSEAQSDRERLVVELASAVKMNQFGLPARIADENQPLIEKWQKSILENPRFIDGLEADVNNAVSMIAKAERGEKIEKKEMPIRQVEQSSKISATVNMIQDDDKRWALFIKPEGEKGFAVYPEKDDVGRYFGSARKNGGVPDEGLRQELAQKYYARVTKDPALKADLFKTMETDIDLSDIMKVNIIRQKDDNKILCYAEIKGIENPEPRAVSPSQWQRMWLADDKNDYKVNLAATLFADILRERQRSEAAKQQEEQKRANSPEQKTKEAREEKQKEAFTRGATGVIAGVVAGGITKDLEQEEHSRGFHR